MSRVFVTMAMSLDGFITGPDDDADNPAGVNGMRLMDWLSADGSGERPGRTTAAVAARSGGPTTRSARSCSTRCSLPGAVITGKRTGDFAELLGRRPPRRCRRSSCPPTRHRPTTRYERVHFVTDGIAECVRQAKEAAGDRDVMLHGAYTAQEALKAGVLDAVELQLRPVLLGQGRRLFDGLPAEHVELDLVRVLEAPGTLHLRYDVQTRSRDD